jgi:hypothetical protein
MMIGYDVIVTYRRSQNNKITEVSLSVTAFSWNIQKALQHFRTSRGNVNYTINTVMNIRIYNEF